MIWNIVQEKLPILLEALQSIIADEKLNS